MAVKLMHYLSFVFQAGVIWMFFAARENLFVYKARLSEFGIFALILGAAFEAVAAAIFVVANEYDGWRIDDFEWPPPLPVSSGGGGAGGVASSTAAPTAAAAAAAAAPVLGANDDRLRVVCYQLLWMFHALGMGFAGVVVLMEFPRQQICCIFRAIFDAIAYISSISWLPQGLAPALAIAAAWVGLSIKKPNMCMLPMGGMRTPVVPLGVFVSAACVYGYALAGLLNQRAWLAVLLFVIGGGFEALGAEGWHNQVCHLFAVLTISAGAVVLMATISQVSGVSLPGGAGWFVGWLVLCCAAMVARARYVPNGGQQSG